MQYLGSREFHFSYEWWLLYVTYTTDFPPRWSGFPGNPDHTSPHKVWMTEGLQYLELFGQAHSRSVPLVLTCSDLDPRDLFVGCSKWRTITTYSRKAQIWFHVVREVRHSNNYRWGKCQFTFELRRSAAEIPSFCKSIPPNVVSATRHNNNNNNNNNNIHRYKTFGRNSSESNRPEIRTCSYGLCLDVLQEKENGQTDPDVTDCTISFRMTSVSCLERLVSRADIRQTFGHHRKLVQSLRQWAEISTVGTLLPLILSKQVLSEKFINTQFYSRNYFSVKTQVKSITAHRPVKNTN